MNRDELKEVIAKIIEKVQEVEAPKPACMFADSTCKDSPCDITTFYSVGEEG